MLRSVFFIVFAWLFVLACSAQSVYNVIEYGANINGIQNNAAVIQKVIDMAAVSGGGKVVVPKGSYVISPIVLKTGVQLHLQKGALLLGSTKRLDYGAGPAQALISASNADNISITGDGEIDGRGALLMADLMVQLGNGSIQDPDWKTKRPTEYNRPKLIHFEQCNNVQVTGVSIKNGSGWIQDYKRCNNVLIDDVKVNSTTYWNNDGIDIVNSKNVTVTNTIVNVSDDAICLKSEGEELDSCVNVYIANCKLRSSANAVKLGTSSKGGFRNIIIENIEVWDTYRSAIALEAVDGGFLKNIAVTKVRAMHTGNAFFIKLGHRNKDEKYSTVSNIRISDVYVEVPAGKPDKGYSMEGPLLRYPPGMRPAKAGGWQTVSPWNHTVKDSMAIIYEHNVFPSSITGLPDHYVQDITLENIEIVYEGGADKRKAFFPWQHLSEITEATTAYPEFSMFGELPAWGLYIRHAKNITLKNVVMRFKKEDYRVACIFDDVINLQLEKLNIPKSQTMPALILNNVKGYEFRELFLPATENEAIVVQ